MRRISAIIILVLGALFSTGFLFGLFPIYASICDKNYYTNIKECASYNLVYYDLLIVYGFIDNHNGIVTALATAVIGYFTYTIWDSNRDQLRHAHQVERAYISGGGAPVFRLVGKSPEIAAAMGIAKMPSTPVPTGEFQLQINNHGKTAGELLRFGIKFCGLAEMPETPDYEIFIFPDWIGPGTQSRPLVNIRIPAHLPDERVVYGRLYYKDIFGDHHSSGFVLKLTNVGSDPLLGPSAAYTEAN